MTDADCVYATSGWGVHDERWVSALIDLGHLPHVVSLGRDVFDELELREAVLSVAGPPGLPVLAGPLHAVALPLVDLPISIIGLSWGYDIADASSEGRDLTWMSRLSGLIVDSHSNEQLAMAAGVPQSSITYLPWGVDLDVWQYGGPWADAFLLGVPPNARLVLSLRAHEPTYRVEDIIRAFAALRRDPAADEDFPDPYLVVGHSGSLTGTLRRLALDLGIAHRVRWVGSLPEEQLIPLFGRASCYVTASSVDGTSVTLLQAMACGTPVVASATAGNLEWVDDGKTGLTFPTGDVEALTSALHDVLVAYPTDMSLRARSLVEHQANWNQNIHRLQQAMPW